MDYTRHYNLSLPSDDDNVEVTQLSGNFAIIDAYLYGKYQKPNGGIPETDLADSVQDSLELADSALQADDVEQTYDPSSENPQSGIAVAKAIENKVDIGIYFNITNDGVVSLKPEYRGATVDYTDTTSTTYQNLGSAICEELNANATSDNGVGVEGSKILELPCDLVIPPYINSIQVTALASGMFAYNHRVNTVVIPNTIETIPYECFAGTINFTNISGTENIEEIQYEAFYRSGIVSASFPNLELMGNRVFSTAGHLESVNIGKITTIPERTFLFCVNLYQVQHNSTITSVGARAFYQTYSLKSLDFIGDLTSIGDYAFKTSGVIYDWNTLSNVTFGTHATPKQMNPSFTSEMFDQTTTPCVNNAPLRISQINPEWANRAINETVNYENGCNFFTVMNAYCGIRDIACDDVYQLEYINQNIDPNLIENFRTGFSTAEFQSWVAGLGLQSTTFVLDPNNYDIVYDTLENGNYIGLTIPASQSLSSGHSILLYGVNANKEVLFVDTSINSYTELGDYTAFAGSIMLQNISVEGVNSFVISKNTTRTALDDKQDILVSGSNIKTINGQPILGSGNINISGGGVVPTKTSDLTNDSGFITNNVSNLLNYYTKAQIDDMIGDIATALSEV